MRFEKILYGVILLMLIFSCCTGGEEGPPETTAPAATAAPTTTAPPTTAPAATEAPAAAPPTTTAPPEEPAVNLNDVSVPIEDIVPEGGSIDVFSEFEYKSLNFPPLKYGQVSAYKVTYPEDFEIYVMRSQSDLASEEFYEASIEQIRSKGFSIRPYPSKKVLYVGDKSLEIQHRLTNEGLYWATLTQKGLYTFYLDMDTEEEAENYLKESMPYLFE